MTMTIHKDAANGTAVEVRRANESVTYEPGSLREAMDLAKWFASSNLVPKALRGNAADLTLIVMAGKEMGLTFTQSMRMLHVVEGRIVSAADLIVAMVKRSPECLYFRLVESTDKIATYETQRRGDPSPTRLSYTIEQAQRAGLAGKDNWRKHTEAMLRARCSAALARVAYPDLAAGMYDPDEAEEFDRRPMREAATEPARVEVVQAPAPDASALVDLLARIAVAPTVDGLKALYKEGAAITPKDSRERQQITDACAARKVQLAPNDDGPRGGGKPAPEATQATEARGTGEPVTGEHEPAPVAWTLEAWRAHAETHTKHFAVANSYAKHERELEASGIADDASDVTIARLIALGLDEAHAVEAIAAACDRRDRKSEGRAA
jgi:hypothetical protein